MQIKSSGHVEWLYQPKNVNRGSFKFFIVKESGVEERRNHTAWTRTLVRVTGREGAPLVSRTTYSSVCDRDSRPRPSDHTPDHGGVPGVCRIVYRAGPLARPAPTAARPLGVAQNCSWPPGFRF